MSKDSLVDLEFLQTPLSLQKIIIKNKGGSDGSSSPHHNYGIGIYLGLLPGAKTIKTQEFTAEDKRRNFHRSD